MLRADPYHDVQSGLDLEWVDDEDRWRELRGVWDDLVLASGTPSIFNTWDFLEVSWSVFARPSGNSLAILVLRENGTPMGFLPFRLATGRRFGLETRRLKRLTSWEADRVPFVFPRGREHECARAVLRFLDSGAGGWDSLELRELPADGGFAEALRERARERGALVSHEDAAGPSPYVRLEGSWEAFLSSLGARSRKEFRRRTRQLGETGPLAVRVFRDPAGVLEGLDRYLSVESRSWKPAAGQGIGKNRRNQVFYRELLPRLAARGRGQVVLLEQCGRYLAGLVELQLGSTAYACQTAFDRDVAAHSPGFVLQGLRLEGGLNEGIRDYELFARFYEDKLRWTKRLRPSVDVVLIRWHGLRRRVLFAGSRLKWLVRKPKPAWTPSTETGPPEQSA